MWSRVLLHRHAELNEGNNVMIYLYNALSAELLYEMTENVGKSDFRAATTAKNSFYCVWFSKKTKNREPNLANGKKFL